MYCKNCNINVKKDKKVCPKCGMALVPGEAKGDPARRIRRIVIISLCAAVAVIALFVCIYLINGVPPELHGTWYEVNGYGYMKFKTYGILTYTAIGQDTDGKYTFNSATNEGIIIYDGKEAAFTCDGNTLSWNNLTLTKKEVPQMEFDFNSMLSGLDLD
jgi:hypothetical protein